MENLEKKYRSYTFAFILYRDSNIYDYEKVIEYISNNFEKYAYIEHLPEKEETKKHTHVLVHFNNKRWNTSLSKELGIPLNYIEKANLKPYLRYLIHYDNEEKIQYTFNDVIGPLKNMLINITRSNAEESDFGEIILYIKTQDRIITFAEITYYCLETGMYSCYRRNLSAIRILLKEHNESIFDVNKII